MYKKFYHLQSEPFNSYPSTDVFFDSWIHREAWYYLLYGIDTGEPFLVLTGECGVGKTLLAFRLVKLLKEKQTSRAEFIPNSNEGYSGILRQMAMSLEISPVPDEQILQGMIYDRLRADKEKPRFYLIIDDAHELSTAVLSKLKYLSTFSYGEFFPIVIIFVGHPSFLQDLTDPALDSLNQRIKRRYHLPRFGLEDTKNYIYFRLLKSGATGIPAFLSEAIEKIFEYSGGVPRQINNITGNCLLIGALSELSVITPSVVDRAKNMLEGSLTASKAASGGTETPMTLMEKYSPPGNKPEQEHFDPPPLLVEMNECQVPDILVHEYQKGQETDILKGVQLTSSRGILKPVLIVAAIVILSVLAYTALSRFIMPGAPDLLSLFRLSGFESSAVQPEKTEVPAADQGGEEIPVLRDEAKAVAPDAKASAYPYLLRSRTYQKENMALQEIAEIRRLGLSPYLVKADLGDDRDVWWIRIGFYATEEEANKVKAAHARLAYAVVSKTDSLPGRRVSQ
ncbi:MAG: AAA family ATPase [Syntrophaceae bacterium]|nr:AAA family ATPase [Syntrophaceae bacterium]